MGTACQIPLSETPAQRQDTQAYGGDGEYSGTKKPAAKAGLSGFRLTRWNPD